MHFLHGVCLPHGVTRLKREVAINILPESFAADPDRLARFQRKAAAAHRVAQLDRGPVGAG
jgi:hypothetical protein